MGSIFFFQPIEEFNSYELAKMNHQRLFPERWKKLIDEKSKRDRCLYEINEELATDACACSGCHESNVLIVNCTHALLMNL